MVSIFSFGLLSLHILKKYAILSLEKAVLATFWASSLGGARTRHQEQNPGYLDFSNHLRYQLTENKRENLPLDVEHLLPAQPGLCSKPSSVSDGSPSMTRRAPQQHQEIIVAVAGEIKINLCKYL